MFEVENIKCPHCGSTAQVIAGDPYIVRNGAYFEQLCHCGCGCCFTVSYPRVINQYFIEYIERKEEK